MRNRLLPDNVQSARFTTTHGPDLKKISGTLYIGAHPGDEQRILWVNVEDQMYPTGKQSKARLIKASFDHLAFLVYTLWKNAGILPLLHTPNIVVDKLRTGADLMTPGLAGPPFPSKAKKGSLVAVASIENPSVPVAVGTCVIDVSSLESVKGAKGHAVQTAHWCGDELWAWSAIGRPGTNAPQHLEEWLEDGQNGGDLVHQTEDLDLDDDGGEGGGVPLKVVDSTGTTSSDKNPHIEGENAPSNGLFEKVSMPELTTKGKHDVERSFLTNRYYRYRRSFLQSFSLWDSSLQGDEQRSIQLWFRIPAFSVVCHVQSCTAFPPSIYSRAINSSPNQEDHLEKS